MASQLQASCSLALQSLYNIWSNDTTLGHRDSTPYTIQEASATPSLQGKKALVYDRTATGIQGATNHT